MRQYRYCCCSFIYHTALVMVGHSRWHDWRNWRAVIGVCYCWVLMCLQNVTKGARNKILINVQKLQQRATLLRQLEKVCWLMNRFITWFDQ